MALIAFTVIWAFRFVLVYQSPVAWYIAALYGFLVVAGLAGAAPRFAAVVHPGLRETWRHRALEGKATR